MPLEEVEVAEMGPVSFWNESDVPLVAMTNRDHEQTRIMLTMLEPVDAVVVLELVLLTN